MENTLYLMAEEKVLFDALPESAKKGWEEKIKIETLTAFESKDELMKRAQSVRMTDSPELQEFYGKLIASLESDDALDKLDLSQIPNDILPQLFYVFGAAGMTMFIVGALTEGLLTADGMESIATLSGVRHQALVANTVLAS